MSAARREPRRMTAVEYFHYDESDVRTELVRGHLVVRDAASFWHGAVVLNLAA